MGPLGPLGPLGPHWAPLGQDTGGLGPLGPPWAPLGPLGTPWDPLGTPGDKLCCLHPGVALQGQFFPQNFDFFRILWSLKNSIQGFRARLAHFCLWQTHSVSVWKTHRPDVRAGGVRVQLQPHWVHQSPPSHTQDCYPALQGDKCATQARPHGRGPRPWQAYGSVYFV